MHKQNTSILITQVGPKEVQLRQAALHYKWLNLTFFGVAAPTLFSPCMDLAVDTVAVWVLDLGVKLNILKSIVNNDTDSDTPTGRFRTPAPKARTYTTPGKIMSARSETDMSTVGKTPVPTPRSRTQTATVSRFWIVLWACHYQYHCSL
jgi:hypothetical protein